MAIRAAWACTHPLVLCLLLILLASSVSAARGLVGIKWIIYAILLIFLGGIIVVFIYVTILAGNEKFTTIISYKLLFSLLGLSICGIVFNCPLNTQTKKELFMSHIYFSSSTFVLWFLIIFLLATLLIVVKQSENFKGALVKYY
jgi:NADH-ubiquinone oxidoreductase chain 6